ncbi:hypothetical protein MicB006_4803 [Micromonospora sp. B006]|nr:hypothetical protein MicB006_4803 [Micromonospora sp. B006]
MTRVVDDVAMAHTGIMRWNVPSTASVPVKSRIGSSYGRVQDNTWP